MNILSESLVQLIRNNISIYYEFNEDHLYVVLDNDDLADFLYIMQLDHFKLEISEKNQQKSSKIAKNFKEVEVTISFSIEDYVTVKWLSIGKNNSFNESNSFAKCDLYCQFKHCDYETIYGNDFTCNIDIIPSFEFDIDKVNCFASYVDFYNSFNGPIEKKHLILDQFNKYMLLDIRRSSNSLDDMRAKLYAAKLANDPDILAYY